jgi:hypothetical protein
MNKATRQSEILSIATVLGAATMTIIAVPVIPLVSTLLPHIVVMTAAMLPLVTRDILVLVPVVLHKEHPLAAGVVLTTVPAPMFRVARRYAQIDRRAVHRYPVDGYRLAIDHLWLWITANVESTVEPGLSDADGNADVRREGGSHRGSQCCCH